MCSTRARISFGLLSVRTCATVATQFGTVLPASRFRRIIEAPCPATKLYKDCPTSVLGASVRGDILEKVPRSTYSTLFPDEAVSDPVVGFRVNGTRRGRRQANYDWLASGRRIECKSSRLTFDKALNTWTVSFNRIQLHALDELFLVLHLPQKLLLIRHDLQLGLARCGKLTEFCGHKVQVRGGRNESWQAALATILCKFDQGGNQCKVVAEIKTDSHLVLEAIKTHLASYPRHCTPDVYNRVPLASLSNSARGHRIEELVFEVDKILHPEAAFKRCEYRASFDWLKGDIRVECKHGKLFWDKSNQTWICNFTRIKQAFPGIRSKSCFDELLLALYSPCGVHLFKHNGTFAITKVGSKTSVSGMNVRVYGPSKQQDVRIALGAILQKLEAGGCTALAFISW
eukprot:TRINITY_DN21239_c0_g1_i1.p1 TRINITY_DN21239_c0_g1~~TRINITY_DN21239_c0_g1_i1.p1  ORF type:complete len:401 (-),score=32.88 TRINITY_DN21239_c0_g1_i1:33-1235(-)